MPVDAQGQRYEETYLHDGRRIVVTRVRDHSMAGTHIRFEVLDPDGQPHATTTFPASAITDLARSFLDMLTP